MDAGSILLMAVGLAMDATAVAAARGLMVRRVEAKHLILVAGFFGGSQGLMPLLGYALGVGVGQWVQAWDHWIVFILLGGLGLRMLWEARSSQPAPATVPLDPVRGARPQPIASSQTSDAFALPAMFALAVATSIDALAAGVTLPMLGAPLIASSVTIGVVTAVLSAAGLVLGRRFGAALGGRLDALGGLALIGLGTKALLEHLWG